MSKSLAEIIASLPHPQRQEMLAGLNADQLLYDWKFWGRPEQQPPKGNWTTWLILTGRGWGKTRTGAEWVRMRATDPTARIALVAPTAGDVRDVMVEGESGILAIHPPAEMPVYEPSKRRLTWPNGAVATTFSADEPDRLRGPQFTCGWFDELSSWRYPETYDMAMFGMRLGKMPQVVITTTPKPIQIVRTILAQADGTLVVTRGSTYDNKANLSSVFLKQIDRRFGSTRLGRQEIEGQLLEDIPGALWTRAMIDASRVQALPSGLPDYHAPGYHRALAEALGLVRIVVGVDPSGGDGDDENADEVGIVAVGVDHRDEGYVLEDASGSYSPEGWGRRTVEVYNRWGADRIVAERNFGGSLVESNIRAADRMAPVTLVTATRGKAVRAEPVAALFEQGRVHMVGGFPQLEDQLCGFTRTGYQGPGSPDRADGLVWAVSELMLQESAGYSLIGLVGG